MTYYVETYRPAYPGRGVAYRVHSAREFSLERLNPGLTSLWHVEHARTQAEALALVMEKAAGANVTVRKMLGG